MTETVISAENLSKRYRLGSIGGGTLRDDVQRWWAKLRGQADPLTKIGQTDHGNRNGEYVWALRDVSFEVKQGEILGIIGRNGAGKSTLLKILSRITAPTKGQVKVKGRVGSLLEVGTGFHPELTGRENIYLNGAILGMKKDEIDRKLDEIVDFSGVEMYIDTPVKRYSSGMHVRLAFAVAAHLEPEILLVDEVLAVGDAEFQRKCLGKMGDVAKEGRTVLFVSHNMGSVTQLCKSGVWLNSGNIRMHAGANTVVREYLEHASPLFPKVFFDPDRFKLAQYRSICVKRHNGRISAEIDCDEPFIIEFAFEVKHPIPGLYLAFYLQNTEGVRAVFSDVTDALPGISEKLLPGFHRFKITIPERLLAPGTYFVTAGSATTFGGEHIDHCANACSFSIRDFATRRESRPGVIGIRLPWVHIHEEAEYCSQRAVAEV